MTAKAYILLKTAPGLTRSICNLLRVSPMVRSVEMITGPYDLIVCIEASNTNEILKIMMDNIRPAAGIHDTVTCLVLPAEGTD